MKTKTHNLYFQYQDKIPFSLYESKDYKYGNSFQNLALEQYQKFKQYFFSNQQVGIFSLHKGHQIPIINPKYPPINVYLSNKGIFIHIVVAAFRDIMHRKLNLRYVNIPIPTSKIIEITEEIEVPDSQLHYQVDQELFDCLKITADDKDPNKPLVFTTNYLSKPITVTIVARPKSRSTGYSEILAQIDQNCNDQRVSTLDKDQRFLAIVKDSVFFNGSLLKHHLKTINPALVYNIIPLNLPPTDRLFRNTSVYRFNEIPSKFQLLFCVYMLFKHVFPNDPVFHPTEKPSDDVLNMTYLDIENNPGNLWVIVNTLVLKALAVQPTFKGDRLLEITPDFLNQVETWKDIKDADHILALVYNTPDAQFHYISRNPAQPDEWFDSSLNTRSNYSVSDLKKRIKSGLVMIIK